MKWLEVNIEIRGEASKNFYLLEIVKPTLLEFKKKIQSWHFLWEEKPYPSTLRLRFFGKNTEIEILRRYLDKKLRDISHCYGAHGACGENKKYEGEANSKNGWGTKAWNRGIQFLEIGSEFALELVENRKNFGKGPEYKRDAFYYADRYTHLFLNQISSLLDEVDFYLREGVFRYALNTANYKRLEMRRTLLSKDEIGAVIVPMIRPVVEATKKEIQERVEAIVAKGRI